MRHGVAEKSDMSYNIEPIGDVSGPRLHAEPGFWGLSLNLVLAIAVLRWWKRQKANTTLP